MEGWAKTIKDGYPTMQQMHDALVRLSKAIKGSKNVREVSGQRVYRRESRANNDTV